MSSELATRYTWWGWTQTHRDKWEAWFNEHGLDLNDIAEFTVQEETVTVICHTRDDDGKIVGVANREITFETRDHPPMRDTGQPPLAEESPTNS